MSSNNYSSKLYVFEIGVPRTEIIIYKVIAKSASEAIERIKTRDQVEIVKVVPASLNNRATHVVSKRLVE
ncbi:hypothetical protein EKK58_08690 [Candidatus Dependentiae bacterium]|nr:MAG: hypothetical protein EKK58_08690 [Candidatus Dependentiae bacterium]